jgi:hypothetical protein
MSFESCFGGFAGSKSAPTAMGGAEWLHSGVATSFHTALYGNTSVKVHPARSSPFLLA